MEAIEMESMIAFLLTCPFISDFPKLQSDYTGAEADSSGLYDDGEQEAIREDFLGNQLIPHKYALVTRISSVKDTERIQAANFCQRLQVWIREQDLASNYPILPDKYQAFEISASNGRLTARAQDGKTALYEIPIVLMYWRFV